MTRVGALRAFIQHTRAIPQIFAHSVRHGGHGAMWLVQPAVMQSVFERFFARVE
jgi:hypothetical protein